MLTHQHFFDKGGLETGMKLRSSKLLQLLLFI